MVNWRVCSYNNLGQQVRVDSLDNVFVAATLSINVFQTGLSAATYDAGVLTVPVIALDDSYSQLELNISNEQPIEFQLASATAISNPNTVSMSRFAGDTLTIPQWVAASLRYRIELLLTNSDPVTLQLSFAEEPE